MIHKRCMHILPVVTVFIIALIVILPDQGSAKAGDVIAQISAPCQKPQDLAWDGQHLWVLDGQTNRIYMIDPKDGTVLSEMDAVAAQPKGIAWDGRQMWVSDEGEKRIRLIDLQKGKAVKDVKAPIVNAHPDQQSLIHMSGLAWDGKHLWSGCIAGYSSRVTQVSTGGESIDKYIFTHGYPDAIEAGNGLLWSASNCGGKRQAVIYQYEVDGRGLVNKFDAPGKYPAGLAFDGEHLWYADEEAKTIYVLSLR